MAKVELEHVSKTFPGGSHALVDLTLNVADGELLVVVGPSGCGKSTVLRLIAGLEELSSGTIRIGGRAVDDLSPRERNVAMVFQDYALYPNMTVRGNLEFPLRMAKRPPAEIARRVERVADMLGMRELLDRLPRQLSGGQRQRVAMGRALVREPTVFLMDEPLSNLDAKLRGQVRAEIAELQRNLRATMIYVTHDQTEAMTLGDRVAVLERGQLQQLAAPRELYERPANRFVAGFVGSPPMNLLPATLIVSSGGIAVEVGEQRVRAPAQLHAQLARIAGAPETLGIHPEDLALAAGEGDEAFSAEVSHVEYLGHETLAYAVLGNASGEMLIARLPGTVELATGSRIRLSPDWSRIHFFGADGNALYLGHQTDA